MPYTTPCAPSIKNRSVLRKAHSIVLPKMSSYLCLMTFWLRLAAECAGKLFKKHVYNSIEPLPDVEPAYNVSAWVKQLHLQQCVIVEIGEKYCSLFVEQRCTKSENRRKVEEYFLGLCDLKTVRKWKLCPDHLVKERPYKCVFNESSQYSKHPARVHRRLCDISSIAVYGEQCDCNQRVGGKVLYAVTGFPTCFIWPLPDSICSPRNVCGLFSCNASTINHIHAVECYPRCIYGQPFCEYPHHCSTRIPKIDSFWSDWKDPGIDESDQREIMYSESICINKNTGLGAIDCLGPGTNCCPANVQNCKCDVFENNGVLKISRRYQVAKDFWDIFFCRRHRSDPQTCTRRSRSLPNFERFHRFSNFANLNVQNVEKRYQFEEEYEDDDEDMENSKAEDIVFEEGDTEKPAETTEILEKSEVKENQKEMKELILTSTECLDKKCSNGLNIHSNIAIVLVTIPVLFI